MKSDCVTQQTDSRRSIELPVIQDQGRSDGQIAKSRNARWRAAALIALNVLMVAHFVQWRMSGSTVTPIEPSEAMHTLQTGAINAGFIFFSLAILATLIFGRFVCGWGCHLLALQDLCAWLMKKIGVKPRPFRSRLLVWVPLVVAFYMFVWPTLARWIAKPPSEPLFPNFTNHIITTEFWATFPPFWVAVPFLFVCGFMTVYFLGSKGFCTYACPYGGFFSLADRVSPGRIRVTDACNECGHCTTACTSNVLVHKEVKEHKMVVDPGCMKCMDCVSVCPNDALYFGFGKPGSGVTRSVKKNYSLTWREEALAAAVFFVSFVAVWDVYQLVPMLMALGVACVTTFLVVRTIRLFQSPDLTFHKFTLKTGGTMRKAGWAFLSFAVIWIGLNLHSGWIRYNERAGANAFASLQIPDELALAQEDPAEWLSSADKRNIETGRMHFRLAANSGLFVNKEALSKHAWLEFLAGNTSDSVRLLEEAAGFQEGTTRALSLYYRGAILNRLKRHDEAVASLDQALAERPDLATALEEKGEALWQLGRRQQAVETWTEALRANPSLPLAINFLAGAAAEINLPNAPDHQQQALRAAPADAHFHWMLGLRLLNVGMNELANKHFARATELNPAFHLRRPERR